MQTRRAQNYNDLEKSDSYQTRFSLSKGVQIEIDATFFANLPFTVYFITRNLTIPVAVGVTKFSTNERVYGVNEIVVDFEAPESVGADGEPDGFKTHTLVHRVRSKAIGIAPMDTTPIEITTNLPAPTMEEIIRREFNRRFPQKGKVDVEPDIEDEALERSGGKDYSIDDDDPDDPFEVTAADVDSARKRKRSPADKRVQPVDGGSDSEQDPDRGGPGTPPTPAPAESGD